MKTIKDRRITSKGVRVTVFNDGSNSIQKIIPGKINFIDDEQIAGKNSNDSAFYIAHVDAKINGKMQSGTALIWENQLRDYKLPKGTWAPGAPIKLAINLVGPHKGIASIESLGANPFSLNEKEEMAFENLNVNEIEENWLKELYGSILNNESNMPYLKKEFLELENSGDPVENLEYLDERNEHILELIDEIVLYMLREVEELVERKEGEAWFKNPIFRSMRVLDNINTSREEWKNSLTQKKLS